MSLIKNLTYKIKDFSIDIPKWSFVEENITVLSGVSGSGKTSVLKILCGLLSCPSLIWEFKGKDLAKIPPPERRLGVSFQDLRLFPHLSVKENILMAGEARGYRFSSMEKDFKEIISILQIENKLSSFVNQLSGGERQRVALARALLSQPQFLLLDEPFTHLDEKNKKEARFLTKKIIKTRGLGALLISHDLEDVKELADEVFILEKGRLTS